MSSVNNDNSGLDNAEVELPFTTLQQVYGVIKQNASNTVEFLMKELKSKKLDYRDIFNNDFHNITTHELFFCYQQMEAPFWDCINMFLTKHQKNLKRDMFDIFKYELRRNLLSTLEIKKVKQKKMIKKTNAIGGLQVLLSNIYTGKEGETVQTKLRIDCSPIMFKNLTIKERPRSLIFAEKVAPEWSHPLLEIKTLINWPDIGFKLILPGLEYVHSVNNKYKRLLYFSNTKREEKKINVNDLDVYISGNIENQSLKVVSTELTKVYLQLIRKLVQEVSGFTDRRRNEILVVLDAVLQDVGTVKAPSLFVDIECVYARNKYNYYRVRDVSSKAHNPDTSSRDLKKRTIIWETVTPQTKFILKRTSLDGENAASHIKDFTEYFTQVFEHHSQAMKFQELMKKCIKYKCELCTLEFEGVLASYGLQEHIKKIHGSEQNWACENCQKDFDPCKLSTNGWQHVCLI